MRSLGLPYVAPRPDRLVAPITVTLLGCGTVVILDGLVRGSAGAVVVGAVVAGIALIALLVADWLPALVMLVICLPLPAPYSTDRLRIAPAAVVTAAVLAAWVMRRAVDTRRIELGNQPRAPIVGLVGAVALATVFAQYPAIAVRELINWLMLLGLLVAATDTLSATPHRIRSIAYAIAVVMGVSGALATLQGVGVLPGRFPLYGTTLNRATLGFGWPNELGMFLSLGIPFSVFTCEAARGLAARALATGGLAAAAAGLVATFSRGSWLGLLAATLILLLVGRKRFVLRVGIITLGAALVIDLVSGGAVSGRLASTTSDASVNQRMALTLTGLLMFKAYPVLGVGPGGFGPNLEQFGPQVSWLYDYVGSAHNAYVEMAAETGVIGLAAILAFFGSTLMVLVRGARQSINDPSAPAEETSLRHMLAWSFATACCLSLTAWPFAHGLGQLIMLVAAMGSAISCSGGWSSEATAVRGS